MIWSGYENIEGRHSLVVLLIDMQDDFCKRMESQRRQKLVSAQKLILRQCALRKIPLILIEYKGSGETIKELSDPISKVRNKARILKSTDNAFPGDGHDCALNNTLKAIRARTLLVMGVNLSACVLDTAQSAIQLGYRVQTSRDIIANTNYPEWSSDWSWYEESGVLRDHKNLSIVSRPRQQARLVS